MDINDEFSLRNLLEHMAISFVRGDGYDMRICANGEDVTDRIRTREIGLLSSNVAKKAVVRKKLVDIQRKAGDKGDIVAEGRDMGTYVFPEADFKFYLDADIEQRAARRWKELKLSGTETTLAEIKTDIERRDKQDMERAESPLHPAPNAVIIDTTDLEVHEVVGAILNEVESGRLLGSE